MPCMSEDSPRWKTFSKGGLCSPHSSTNMENHELTHCSLSTKRTTFPEPSNLNLHTGLHCCFTSVKVHVLVLLIDYLSCAPTNPFHSTFSVNIVIPGEIAAQIFHSGFNHSHFMVSQWAKCRHPQGDLTCHIMYDFMSIIKFTNIIHELG